MPGRESPQLERTSRWLRAWVAASLCLVPACDGSTDDGPGAGGLGMSVRALSTESCSGSNGNGTPLSEISKVTVVVSGTDPITQQYEPELLKQTKSLKGNRQVTVKDVDEGSGHQVQLFGATADGEISWYAMDPDVEVLRNQTNEVDLLLSRFGGFLCAQADDNTYTNVVFPAVTELGDGRLMTLGGFRTIIKDDVNSNTYLAGASSKGIIFDPKTGEITGPFDMGEENARGAHALVFIPPPPSTDDEAASSGQVLVIGGMTRLRLDTREPFPFRLGNDKSRVLNDVMLYDIDSNTFTELPGEIMDAKRAFPRAALMSDGTVVISGGGGWPTEEAGAYKAVEIFDPYRSGGPGFLEIVSFEGEVARAGHTMTFLKNDENGQSHFLLWGGTDDVSSAAEVLRQSSQQRDGVDGVVASVIEGGNGSGPFSTYFHEMTPLDDTLPGDPYCKDENGNGGSAKPCRRFLLTGGVVKDGDGLAMPQNEDDAWVLTYSDEHTPELTLLRAPGFGQGRVFHTAASSDGQHVSVIGGFAPASCGDDCYTFPTIGAGSIRFFDLDDWSLVVPDCQDPCASACGCPADCAECTESCVDNSCAWTDAPDGDIFTNRGGMGGQMMRSGSVFLVGGEPELSLSAFGADPSKAVIELYTPSNIPQP